MSGTTLRVEGPHGTSLPTPLLAASHETPYVPDLKVHMLVSQWQTWAKVSAIFTLPTQL
jgi:hypothetical protein